MPAFEWGGEEMAAGQPPNKRDVILHSAMQVFSRKGFHDSTMEDVAQEAGVGKGTVYLYFPSKQALIEEIFRYSINLYVDAVDKMSQDHTCLRTQLEAILVHVLAMAERNQQASGLFLEGATGMSEEFKGWVIDSKSILLDRYADLLAQATQRGQIRLVDVRMWAHLIAGGVDSLVTTVLWGKAAPDHHRLAQQVVDAWWSGLMSRELNA